LSSEEGGAPAAGAWRFAQAAAVFLVLAFFLYSLRDLLTPFVLFWVLVAVLLPFRGTTGHTLLIVLAAVLTFFWILDTTGFLLAPFVLALVLAYVLDPLVDRIEEAGVARTLSILLLALPILGVGAAAIFLGVPALGDQVADLLRNAPDMLRRLAGWADAMQERFLRIDVPLVEEERLIDDLRNVSPDDVMAFFEARRAEIGRRIWGGVLGVGF